MNGDGLPDLVLANAGSHNTTILLGIPPAGFAGFSQPSQSPIAGGTSPQSAVIGDFTGDGKLDVLTVNAGSDDIRVLINATAYAANGTPCNDYNSCTQLDSCHAGVCVGANPVVCAASDQCHGAGACESRNGACSNPSKPDGFGCDDGNSCTVGDACGGGVCLSGTPITPPAETQNVTVSADKTTYSWSQAAYAMRYDVVRGSTGAFPVGPGGGNEVCFDDLAGATVIDSAVPSPDSGFWYLSRGENACGIGTFGTQSDGSPRTTTTCP